MRCGMIYFIQESVSGKAIQVRQGNQDPVWVPKSQIEKSYLDKSGTQQIPGFIEIPGWLAEAKELT